MKISITRSGGFVGKSELLADVDTTTLSDDVALQIERKLQSVGFFNLPADVKDKVPGADFFRYEIAVVDGQRRHSVAFNDSGGPLQTSLLELVSIVTSNSESAA